VCERVCVVCVCVIVCVCVCVLCVGVGGCECGSLSRRASAPFVDGPASTCLSADPGPGPSFGGEHRPFEWGWRAVGLCFPCLRWWGRLCRRRCAPGAVPVLSLCGEVSLGGIQSSSSLAGPLHRADGARAQDWRARDAMQEHRPREAAGQRLARPRGGLPRLLNLVRATTRYIYICIYIYIYNIYIYIYIYRLLSDAARLYCWCLLSTYSYSQQGPSYRLGL